MAKTTVLDSIARPFERHVNQLSQQASEIVSSYADLTSRMLAFAASFKAATDEARRLDKGGDGVHAQYLKDTLAETLKTGDASIWSKWNTIGTYAAKLTDYANALPPQRDSLYELALAVSEKRPLTKWVENETVTIDSSVRELRALRKTKSAAGKKVSASRRRHLNATVTLCFKSYDDAVSVLSDLLFSHKQIEVRSHHAFAEALKARVGPDEFNKIKHRIS